MVQRLVVRSLTEMRPAAPTREQPAPTVATTPRVEVANQPRPAAATARVVHPHAPKPPRPPKATTAPPVVEYAQVEEQDLMDVDIQKEQPLRVSLTMKKPKGRSSRSVSAEVGDRGQPLEQPQDEEEKSREPTGPGRRRRVTLGGQPPQDPGGSDGDGDEDGNIPSPRGPVPPREPDDGPEGEPPVGDAAAGTAECEVPEGTPQPEGGRVWRFRICTREGNPRNRWVTVRMTNRVVLKGQLLPDDVVSIVDGGLDRYFTATIPTTKYPTEREEFGSLRAEQVLDEFQRYAVNHNRMTATDELIVGRNGVPGELWSRLLDRFPPNLRAVLLDAGDRMARVRASVLHPAIRQGRPAAPDVDYLTLADVRALVYEPEHAVAVTRARNSLRSLRYDSRQNWYDNSLRFNRLRDLVNPHPRHLYNFPLGLPHGRRGGL